MNTPKGDVLSATHGGSAREDNKSPGRDVHGLTSKVKNNG